jgi:hypothetical protein
VGKSFQNNRFQFVWPIIFLRWFGNIFFQVSMSTASDNHHHSLIALLTPDQADSCWCSAGSSPSCLACCTCWLQILDIMTLTLFLMALDCQYFSRAPEQIFYNQEFPDVCELHLKDKQCARP